MRRDILLNNEKIEEIFRIKKIIDQRELIGPFDRVEKKQVIIHVIICKRNTKKTFIHTKIQIISVGKF